VEGFTDAITAHRAAIDDDDPPGDLPVDVGTGESLKIYTVAAFEDAIEANYASYWRLYGYDVSIEVIPGYPQTATAEDAQVNDLMARIAANTAAGVKYHEIWGRDNPYHYMHGERWSSYWTGPWLAIHGQMENRYLSTADDIVIPAPTVRDDLPRGQNVSYWWPYFRSDKMYEVPGSVVTRVPVSHLWQIAAYSFIIQQTNDFWSNPSYGMGMGLFVGDLDHMGDGDGQLAWAAADMTRAMLAERGHYLTIVRESVIPNPELRNRHMADQWNGYLGGRTNLNFMYASQSGPHYPGNMYSKRELGDDVWRMDLVFPYINHHPMFIAPTCATSAAWAIDDSWYYHTAVVIDMLFHEAGASGYYGPSCGSLTSSNQEIGYIVADYVTADFSRPTFESIALAEQEIAALYSDNPRINLQLLTMSKIGSALTRVGQVQVVTAVGDQIPQLTHLAQNTPNPFNPKTSIQFEIKDAGRVTLKVFNIRGSLVKTLIDDVLPAGPHHSVWDGTDGGGRQVASGTYFYRIEVGSRSVSRKMSLLK